MRPIRPLLLASAAVLLAAACSRDATAPGGPTIAGAPEAEPSRSPFFLSATAPDTTTKDSVIGGYGSNPCGGLDYQEFEYDPDTGTEYVVCPDTTGTSRGLEPTPTEPAPAPAPTPAPKATSPASGSTTTQDSVTSGYGSGSTGGIEYDPETGTEPRDTTPRPKTGS